jgi:hypothetical protein
MCTNTGLVFNQTKSICLYACVALKRAICWVPLVHLKGAKKGQRWVKDGSKMGQRWDKDEDLVQRRGQDGAKMGQRWGPCAKMGQRWGKDGTKMEQRWGPGAKIGQRWGKEGAKMEHSWKKMETFPIAQRIKAQHATQQSFDCIGSMP